MSTSYTSYEDNGKERRFAEAFNAVMVSNTIPRVIGLPAPTAPEGCIPLMRHRTGPEEDYHEYRKGGWCQTCMMIGFRAPKGWQYKTGKGK